MLKHYFDGIRPIVLQSLVFFGANLWYWIKHGMMGNSFDINSVNYHHCLTNKILYRWYVHSLRTLLLIGYSPGTPQPVWTWQQREKSLSLLGIVTWFATLQFCPCKLSCGDQMKSLLSYVEKSVTNITTTSWEANCSSPSQNFPAFYGTFWVTQKRVFTTARRMSLS